MSLETILDILMVVLLAATIAYAVLLNRKLADFRKNRSEVEAFVRAFTEATERAETSILRLKAIADETGAQLQERIDKGAALQEELAFMADRGDSIADRLERAASGTGKLAERVQAAQPPPAQAAPAPPRPVAAAPTPPPPSGRPDPEDLDAGRSEAERDLLKALRSIR